MIPEQIVKLVLANDGLIFGSYVTSFIRGDQDFSDIDIQLENPRQFLNQLSIFGSVVDVTKDPNYFDNVYRRKYQFLDDTNQVIPFDITTFGRPINDFDISLIYLSQNGLGFWQHQDLTFFDIYRNIQLKQFIVIGKSDMIDFRIQKYQERGWTLLN